jgi:hypothetical protein
MKKKFSNSLFIFFLPMVLLIVSCNNHPIFFEIAEEFKIPKDNDIRFVDYFVSDGVESMVVFNQVDSLLTFRPLTDMRVRKKIPLHRIFNNKTEKKYFSRFVVYRQDSVFVQYRNHIFLLDDNGRLLNEWDGDGASTFSGEISSMAPLTFFGNCLYFPLVGSYDLTQPEERKKYFSQVLPVASLDISTSEWAVLPISFPEIYKNGDFYLDVVPFINHYHDALVVSFGLSDSIYFYEPHADALNGYMCESRYKENAVAFDDDSSRNMVYHKRYDFGQFRYTDIFIDKQQNMLYRFATLPTPLHQKDGFTTRKAKDWSLIVFDIEAKVVVAEQRFDSREWAPFAMEASDGVLAWRMTERTADSLQIVKLKYKPKR